MRSIVLILLTLAMALSGCGSAYEIPGWHAAAPPALDGTHAGWQGRMFDLERLQVYAGVQEDSQYVYLCVESPEREMAGAMMKMGIQVMVIPEGETKRKFGIRFPVADSRRPEEAGGLGSEMEFIGPEGKVILRTSSLMAEREYGFAVALKPAGPSTLFQCKIPRVPRAHGLGIGPLAGGFLEFAIEIPRGRGGAARGMRGEEEVGFGAGESPGDNPGEGVSGQGGRPGGGGGRRGGGPGRGKMGEGGPPSRSAAETETVVLHVKMPAHD